MALTNISEGGAMVFDSCVVFVPRPASSLIFLRSYSPLRPNRTPCRGSGLRVPQCPPNRRVLVEVSIAPHAGNGPFCVRSRPPVPA